MKNIIKIILFHYSMEWGSHVCIQKEVSMINEK